MIQKLTVNGFTVFPEQQVFEFVPGINVVVGGNDSGKSHLLKLVYTITKWSSEGGQKSLPEIWAQEQRLRKNLIRVFSARNLGSLTAQNRGNAHARVQATITSPGVPHELGLLAFDFCVTHETDGLHIRELPKRFLQYPVVFLTSREILSLYPYFARTGDKMMDFLDGCSWNLCHYLDQPCKNVPLNESIERVVSQLEKMIGGKVVKQEGRFFLQRTNGCLIEMSLVAEGFKRLCTLSYLLKSGIVTQKSVLFWDEPEIHLNAARLPTLVNVLMSLVRAGVQIFLSSHSLFLLRELTIQLAKSENAVVPRRFFGLCVPHKADHGVKMVCGDSLEDVGPLDSLTAEIEQADRYLRLSYES